MLATDQSKNNKDGPATKKELTEYRSVIGKFLYIGQLHSPAIAYYASQAATKYSHLRLHHIRALYATIRPIRKTCSCVILYLPSNGQSFKMEATLDASMQTKNEMTNVREGLIIF